MAAGWRADMTGVLGDGASLCFGELLVRLSTPGNLLLSQSASLEMVVGGAEANVAVGLASLGRQARMVSRVPDNSLGEMVRGVLRGHGVDCTGVATADEGRMGLYFLEPGAGARASRITYDRKGSSFALSGPNDYDWNALLNGVSHLHLSGITPALGDGPAMAALAAARAARAKGLFVSIDGNYRAQLWAERDVNPRNTLPDLFAQADLLFANHRDFSLLLDRSYSGDGPERRREAALAAFAAFPNLQMIASTARRAEEADRQFLAARVDTRDLAAQTDELLITNIVDRIGTGDAFATGVLYALCEGQALAQVAQTGLAVAALKHSISGDLCLVSRTQLDAFLSGQLDVQR
jgi:2-dehydro-3-deoxygluconokinase